MGSMSASINPGFPRLRAERPGAARDLVTGVLSIGAGSVNDLLTILRAAWNFVPCRAFGYSGVIKIKVNGWVAHGGTLLAVPRKPTVITGYPIASLPPPSLHSRGGAPSPNNR